MDLKSTFEVSAFDGFSFEDVLTSKAVNKVKSKKKSSDIFISKRKSEVGTSQYSKYGVPVPNKKIKLSSTDILSSIPDSQVTESEQEKRIKKTLSLEKVAQRSYNRIGIFSGSKNSSKGVPTLYISCIQMVKNNMDLLKDVGGIPYSTMKPIFTTCTAKQLRTIEYYNPQFLKEADELWRIHCQVTFKIFTKYVNENWRQCYLRQSDERERKFKTVSFKIAYSQANAAPVRATKCAYVDSHAKPSLAVLQVQTTFGTAFTTKDQHRLAKLSSRPETKIKEYMPDIPSNQTRPDKTKAPMMQKLLKNMHQSRRLKKRHI